MINEATESELTTLRFRRQVADRFGLLPNFFCTAEAAPGLIEELWKFAKSAYLDLPLPALFKERLFVHLSRFCAIRYCIVRHVGFLIGKGRPAGDAVAEPETIDQVIEMLQRPLPDGPALTSVLERLEQGPLTDGMPEPRTQCEGDLFDALTIMFLAPPNSARARDAVRACVGDGAFELLVAYLAFIRTAHYWTEMHPELKYETDIAEVMNGHDALAKLLLDPAEAERVQGTARLRDTLHELRRVEGALLESESRHTFLLRLADAVRPLVNPTDIQGEASRLLAERLTADRACYAEIDEVQGVIRIESNHLRAGAPSLVGQYALEAFTRFIPAPGMVRPIVISDTRAAESIPEADHPVLDRIGVGAFVAAPLIREGRLVAALCVSDVRPRAWTPEEAELVKETAERTWEAIERARAEEQLREANARKDEFLAMLAHELRNPLAPIRTGLELIRRTGDTPEAVERVRAMMERQVGHIVRLVDDLLDVSRITSGKIVIRPEPTALRGLIHSAVEANRTAMADKRIDLSAQLPDEDCAINVDPTRFVQVLSNLLHNAAKFTHPGGSVRIATSVAPATNDAGARVTITVTDSGVGIAADLLPRVFELFTQGETRTSQPGLGIGLSLARRLVELHGGRVEARSDGPGRGSEFAIHLPLATSPAKTGTERRVHDAHLERRILVIDDNQDAANATAMLIQAMGGRAKLAYDGQSALAMLEDFQPEVVLLDIGMPGLDGYETCKRIRRVMGSATLIVALTGFGQERDKDKALLVGFDAHLTKPADSAALGEIVAAIAPRLVQRQSDSRPAEGQS